ncbi:cytochrome c peroxidase [Commensalibacter papalotli (ex Botero et al. 2024)]|uniref:Cytochrome c peroxidase (MauG) (PDB:1EB7) n=1 Tax=Commensalibacter papalotli (ex Botero et al. 2024) TaxID=2972766 RepID=A0ABN8W8G3_9PROT|nr:cytochrome c peroxidase [Commensalibacter papalotli (ex Botero et al. 2024)]CAI3923741.1 Cytochrome c peroxidase (MauG) (PDB:1EB7) [Commensalibacter papalotli (ex Botero et al. 2024)]CAI3928294.1 Cytochrome c peroxidase (MauG) (PDB:1EB7) [Commensalibacter papalotli (ex Botero et al. 2024)]
MKKLILAIIVLGAVVYGGTTLYLSSFDRKTAPRLAENSPSHSDAVTMAAFDVLKEARCDYCHAENVELPFYFKLPIASSLMEQDRFKGLRNFRMEPVIAAINEGKPVGLVALSRIEFVMQRNLMPPTLYLIMHWHARLSEQQRDDVIKWVRQERQKYYATQGVADRFASEPVQPVPESVPVDPKLVVLGKELFFEKRLSGDNTLSCASCHDLQKGGVDGLVTATGIFGQKGPINVPTVYNSVFNHSQFWDGRAADLEEQAAGPVMNPLEMGSKTWEDVINKLRQEPSYEKRFEEAFGTPVIDKQRITDAIGAYEKTLITPDSPFDMYLKGVDGAINAQAKRGYELFKENGCASCHNGVALGGAAYEELGLQKDYFADRGGKLTDADMGRFNVTHKDMDKHSFKVPLLRNIALTGPYFHDGSVKTLKEAVEKMLKYQTPYHKLTDQEVDDIVAFLKTLTGKYQGQSIDKLAP